MSASPATSPEKQPLFPSIEEGVSAHWAAERIFERSIEERPADKVFTFYDGPPFATGLPHYGHLLQSAIKDAVPRYWTMQGYRVPRKWGWDCHGLPIENIIEKELKLGSKKDIETYGIGKFNAACRTAIFAYEKEWGKYIDRLGRWVEFEDSYKTMDNNYIESVWWVFSELHKKDYIYKGFRVSLYCPRCATPISNFEVAMGNSYIDREDPAVFVKFPATGDLAQIEGKKVFFLAWTTTPWTLPANSGLSVHPDLTYVAVTAAGSEDVLILAEARLADVFQGAETTVLARWSGKELEDKTYEALYSYLPVEGNGFRVVTGDHVTAADGTGIVHTAPAFGEEDLKVGKAKQLPIIQTLNDEGVFVSAVGMLGGRTTKEANPIVIDDLQERGLLFREEKITHSVAICWRCDTHLLYKAQDAWFVNVTQLKPTMLKTAEKIHWHPEHFKEGRFGRGLDSAPDWNISRSRYWGSPIPVWECTSCTERTVIGSIQELKAKAKPGTWPDAFDAHRPMIDNIVLSCSCGGEQKRIPEVFDCWFESGSMPVASVHYPFENKKWFEQNFPADFIGEAQDQTRGWFYNLHVLATALFDKPAFKDVIVTGLILAEDGKKMSKKLKNYPDPWVVLTTHGADALRYYLLSSPVVEADSLNFSERDLQSVVRGFLNLLWNVKTFYETYAKDERVEVTMPRSVHILDRWLFSRYHQLLGEVTTAMDGYELAVATRPLRAFVDDLSTSF
jgi:isoleucyl-tRNA synthetase